jgi:hypothetical protein
MSMRRAKRDIDQYDRGASDAAIRIAPRHLAVTEFRRP